MMDAVRRSSRTHATRALALLLALLACAGVLAAHASPAVAIVLPGGVGSVQPADEDFTPSDSFATNQQLFANVRAGIRGGTICVLDEIFLEDVESNKLNCGENEDQFGTDPYYAPWTTPNAVQGDGSLDFMPIEAPPLKKGRYFILGDQGSIAGVDLCCDVASIPFEVSSCEQDCDKTIGTDVAKAYKDSARVIAFPPNGSPLASKLACLGTTAALFAGPVYGGAIALSGLGFSVVGSTVSVVGAGAFGLFGFSLATGIELGVLSQGLFWSHFVFCRQAQMWSDIANDPPDMNFHQVVQPALTMAPPLGDPLAEKLIATSNAITAYGKAQLTSYERYQGAVQEHDAAAAEQQAEATSDYGLKMTRAIRENAAVLRRIGPAMAADPATPDPLM